MKYSKAEMKRQALEYWPRFLPNATKELKNASKFEETIDAAVNRTAEALELTEKRLIEQGDHTTEQAQDTAWELLWNEWLMPQPENCDLL